MQMTPTVAAVPNAVPVKVEIRQHSKNEMRIKIEGEIIFEE